MGFNGLGLGFMVLEFIGFGFQGFGFTGLGVRVFEAHKVWGSDLVEDG